MPRAPGPEEVSAPGWLCVVWISIPRLSTENTPVVPTSTLLLFCLSVFQYSIPILYLNPIAYMR